MRRVATALLPAVIVLAACGGGDEADSTTTTAPTTTSTTEAAADEATTTTTAPGAQGEDVDGFVPAPLEWSDCGQGTDCASLEVPLDWADPTGDTITLALRRAPATGDPADKIGILTFNLGGPGATTNDAVPGGLFDPAINERYDVIGWDVRGVGDTEPLECGDNVDAFVRLDSEPDDAQEQAALDDAAQAVGAECEQEDEPLLAHMGTDDVARDLEAIRIASGEPMSYYGFSYGTLIGLRYLDLFPTSPLHVGIDGVVDPEDTLTDLLRGQTVGFEAAMATVFAGCPAGQGGCPEGGAEAAYDQLAAQVEQQPLPAGNDVLGPADLATAAIFVTYDESLWDQLYSALSDGLGGDGRSLLRLAEGYRSLGGFTAYQAVECTDSVNPRGSEAWAAFSDELEAVSPRFGGSIANEMLPCAFWPVEPRPIVGPVVAEGSPPVLVIGTTGDPATPIDQARHVAENLADGHLLTFDGEGHTAYFSSGCVRDAVAAYLLDGELPADGATC